MASLSIDPKEFNTSVRPTDDFFEHVNGGWINKNPIPPEESQWGSFVILRVQVEEQLKAILDDLAKQDNLPKGSVAQKVRDFYKTGMDLETRNHLRAEPLKELLGAVDRVVSREDLPRVLGTLHRAGAWAGWSPFVDQDQKQSDMMALYLYQGGLGLPDRDYYLAEDDRSREIREKYSRYIVAMCSLLGWNAETCGRAAQVVMDIETRLAKASRTRVELRDVVKQYNKKTPEELAALTPEFGWEAYFRALKTDPPSYFIVGQPQFFEEVGHLLGEAPLQDLKFYFSWHVVNSMAGYLSEEFERLSFDFYARTFNGATEMKALWRRVLAAENDLLDEALGELYVKKHFSAEAKQKINVLVDNLVAAYRARIEKLDWMADATKKKALEKLGMFSRKLGYPDVWRDYTSLTIGTDSYVLNYLRAYAFEFDRRMQKVGKPVDRTEWLMPPQMVNAYYQPPMNEIVFPAAILQPPFFDPNADDALNYGGIGEVIGHELTHGFDDQGALFNGKGNLENWWTKEDKERFDAKAAGLVKQFDAYEPLPGLHVQGKLTLGENIADLGGLAIAYDALMLALKGRAINPIDGFSPVERFFINYAVSERIQVREELLRLKIQVDTHAPSKYRVNGPISNMAEFYDAFHAKEGDALWRKPGDRVKIW